MQCQEDLCVLSAECLVYPAPVSCYFYFVLLPHGFDVWLVKYCFFLSLYIDLLIDLYEGSDECLVVFVNCLVKQFTICLGVTAIFLLNAMVLLSVGGDDLLERPLMVFHSVCVLCL